jgi:hypothetical protein
MSRALRRHHRARLIRRVVGYSEWFRERANKLYDHPKFCTCAIPGCGNPRRLLKSSKGKALTLQERRSLESAIDAA